MYTIQCPNPTCKKDSYDHLSGCLSCGYKCAWPATIPTAYQYDASYVGPLKHAPKFQKHGQTLVSVGGSSLAPPTWNEFMSLTRLDGISIVNPDLDLPNVQLLTFTAGSLVLNKARYNLIYQHDEWVGAKRNGDALIFQYAFRIYCFDTADKVHFSPSDGITRDDIPLDFRAQNQPSPF